MTKLDNRVPPPPLAEEISIGHLIGNRWIYMGTFQPLPEAKIMDLYSANDYLDDNGKIMLLTFGTYHVPENSPFEKAMTEIAKRNGGRSYGGEEQTRLSMVDGTYTDGDLFLPFREFVNGRDQTGEFVRPINLVSLLDTVAGFRGILENVRNGTREEQWLLTGTMHEGNDQLPYHVNLTNGKDYWPDKANPQSPVVPFCAVRRLPTKEF